ncbi:MAG: prepilin-type N-terminal cleavage/methylation domain-containing protein [Planctomycetota bacterium]
MRRSRYTPGAARAGFTLIEVLAVILIIAILSAFLVTRLTGAREAVETENTRGFIAQLAAAIEEYEGERNDYPRSTFPKDLDPRPTRTNMGAEMLVISLYPADGSWRGLELPDDRLVNTDEDDTKRSLTRFPSAEVFEFADDWGNPIAYLHRRDYEQAADYVTFDQKTGESVESPVMGIKNPVTGDFYNPGKFQLLSAGADGLFGTEDDIGNFRRRD